MEDMKKRETSEVKGSVSVSHHPLSLITQELMYTKVQVMENPKCREWFENESKLLDEKWGFGKGDWPPIVNITENQLCSGDAQTRTGACYGDSGKNENHIIPQEENFIEQLFRRASYCPKRVLCAGRGGRGWGCRGKMRPARGAQHLHKGRSICRVVEGGRDY